MRACAVMGERELQLFIVKFFSLFLLLSTAMMIELSGTFQRFYHIHNNINRLGESTHTYTQTHAPYEVQ